MQKHLSKIYSVLSGNKLFLDHIRSPLLSLLIPPDLEIARILKWNIFWLFLYFKSKNLKLFKSYNLLMKIEKMLHSIFLKRNKQLFLKFISFLLVLLLWWAVPFSIFKLFLSSLLFFLFPGFFVLNFLKTKEWTEILLFSILFGFTFQIILSYTFSLLNLPFLSLFLLLPSLLFWIFTPSFPPFQTSDKKTLFFLFLIFLFHLVLYLYPSSTVVKDAWRNVGFLPVGDDSKHHLLIVKSILREGKIPTSYYLYPEIPLIYPAGYHVIISILYHFSSFDLLKLMFFFPLFSLFLLILSSFVFASRVLSRQAGYISSLLIPSIPQTIIMVTYGNSPQLLSLPFLFASFSLLFNKQASKYLLPIIFSPIFFLSPYSLFLGLVTIPLFFTVTRNFIQLPIFLVLCFFFSLPLFLFILLYNPPNNSFMSENDLINLWIYSLPERISISDLILFLRPFNEVIIAFGLLTIPFLKQRKTLFFFLIFILSVFLFLLIRRMPLFLNEFGFVSVRFSLSDTRILFLVFYPLTFLASFFLSRLKIRGTFLVFFVILLVLPLQLEREKLNLQYRTITLGDWEYIRFINKSIPMNVIFYNDYSRGTITNSLPAFVERKETYPFTPVQLDLDFSGEREIIRNIPDSLLALDILKRKNVSYITFSTGFNLESIFGFPIPLFNPNNFKSCYEKVYANYSQWIFKINYNCTTFTYFPLFLTCKERCRLPSSINVEIPEFLRHFRLLLLAKVYPSNIAYTIGFTEVFQNEEKIALWPMIRDKKEFLFVTELNSKEALNIKFKGERPYVRDLMIVAEVNGSEISLAKDVWAIFLNNRDIIVFNPELVKIKLVMVYNNTKGNVYFNLFNYSISSWIPIGSIERNSTFTLLKKEIELPEDKFLFLSIASHEFPFEIHNISIIPSNYIFLDAESSWIGSKIVKIEELNLSSFFSPSPNVYLRGNWKFEKGKVILPSKTLDCQLVLSNFSKNFYLRIIYEDKGESEININYWNDMLKKWETVLIFNTTGTQKVKEIDIPFFTFKRGVILNFYSHKEELEILNLTSES